MKIVNARLSLRTLFICCLNRDYNILPPSVSCTYPSLQEQVQCSSWLVSFFLVVKTRCSSRFTVRFHYFLADNFYYFCLCILLNLELAVALYVSSCYKLCAFHSIGCFRKGKCIGVGSIKLFSTCISALITVDFLYGMFI